jgi:hypothetical protein
MLRLVSAAHCCSSGWHQKSDEICIFYLCGKRQKDFFCLTDSHSCSSQNLQKYLKFPPALHIHGITAYYTVYDYKAAIISCSCQSWELKVISLLFYMYVCMYICIESSPHGVVKLYIKDEDIRF